MTDTNQTADDIIDGEATEETEDTKDTKYSPWDTIANDFQKLGQNLADAIKDTLNDENTKKHLGELRTGLQNMVEQVAGAVDEAVKSPAASTAKTEVKKAVGEVKDIGGKVYSESRPMLINALKQLEKGIQTIVARLDDDTKTEETPAPDTEDE